MQLYAHSLMENSKLMERLQDHATEDIVQPWKLTDEVLGKGAFGVVYLATDYIGFNFAVKIADKGEVEQDCLLTEIDLLTTLSHENLVKCFGWGETIKHVFMYLERMEGSIRDKMDTQGRPLELEEAQKYTSQAIQGLEYLHANDLIHRDIKCANILLNSDNAKIADMGLVGTHKMQTMKESGVGFNGTFLYISPEVFTKRFQAGKRSDVWALGCTVYEMLKFRPPFYSSRIFFIRGIETGKLNHQNLIKSDPELAGNVGSFLQEIFKKFEDRLYARDIAEHEWLVPVVNEAAEIAQHNWPGSPVNNAVLNTSGPCLQSFHQNTMMGLYPYTSSPYPQNFHQYTMLRPYPYTTDYGVLSDPMLNYNAVLNTSGPYPQNFHQNTMMGPCHYTSGYRV